MPSVKAEKRAGSEMGQANQWTVMDMEENGEKEINETESNTTSHQENNKIGPVCESTVNDLIRAANACMADDAAAVRIANNIDEFLNERTELSLEPKAMRRVGSGGNGLLPEVSRLRETKVLLRIRFPGMPMSSISRDSLKQNDQPLLSALVSYSDILRSRALSLLRRLAALRSRMHLQNTVMETLLEPAGTGAEGSSKAEYDEMGQKRKFMERKNSLHEDRSRATFQEIEDLTLDVFRKSSPELQLKTIEHEILAELRSAGRMCGLRSRG
jgi:hypothetical protein